MVARAVTLSEPGGCPSGLAPQREADAPQADPAVFVRPDANGDDTLEMLVEGARCAACIRKIEGALLATPGVHTARLNLSTRRLRVSWTPKAQSGRDIIAVLADAGYAATPFDPAAGQRLVDKEGRQLLRALAVAGFASMNVMMFSVPIWSGDLDMGPSTRTMMHLWSAVIAVPAALYAGQPFFRSAFNALKHGRANMDVPISLGVILTLAMSLYETAVGGHRAYFDGACMLLFLLLIGRYLDHLLREKARTAASDLLSMQSTTASRMGPGGRLESVAAGALRVGDEILVAPGERTPVDARIVTGESWFDCALLTGETLPVHMTSDMLVHAGAINLTRPLKLVVAAEAETSLVAQLARLIEIGEQGRARFVRIADKAAALYVPLVHSVAALTFLGWTFAPRLFSSIGMPILPDIGLHGAMMNAIAVLIITCPCALGLAAPAVQVVATGRLFRRGVLVKSGDALERIAQIDTVVFDKTGTLTLGKPRLVTALPSQTLQTAAALARASRHPLSRALVAAAGPGRTAANIEETAGQGLTGDVDGVPCRLGQRAFVHGNDAAQSHEDGGGAEVWFRHGDDAPVRFEFEDALRPDAAAVISALRKRNLSIELLSGDRVSAVRDAACAAGIDVWSADVRPDAKVARLEALRAEGRHVLMIGDGLNDAAALAAAHASAAPGAAVEIAQSAADVVFTGVTLAPLVDIIDTARSAQARVYENFSFSALYNILAIPVAVAGLVTPLIAALAMAGSSLAVTLNALRLQGMRTWTSSST